MFKKYEAGVSEAVYPYSVRWTGDFVLAETAERAEESFELKGYYRNLYVREVPSV